jgi:hypothetical protein
LIEKGYDVMILGGDRFYFKGYIIVMTVYGLLTYSMLDKKVNIQIEKVVAG